MMLSLKIVCVLVGAILCVESLTLGDLFKGGCLFTLGILVGVLPFSF